MTITQSHTNTHTHKAQQQVIGFTELTVNATTIDPILESSRIDTLCFQLTVSSPLLGSPLPPKGLRSSVWAARQASET